MLREKKIQPDKAVFVAIAWLLIIGMLPLMIRPAVFFTQEPEPYIEKLRGIAGDAAYCTAIGLSARDSLEQSLGRCVDSYKNIWQTVGTAAYNSNAESLDLILGKNAIIEETAAEYGIDKAMIQSILFQELRFINVLDEVDACVEAAFLLLDEQEASGTPSPWLTISAADPVMAGFYFTDSSTGLGQIYARSAIKALNWYSRTTLYDEDDWRDRERIWLNLKYDDAYNIHMIGLLCRYNASTITASGRIESPSVQDVFRIYNGSGPWAVKYGEVTYLYYLAFSAYNKDTAYQKL